MARPRASKCRASSFAHCILREHNKQTTAGPMKPRCKRTCGVLDRALYAPVIERGWAALARAVHPDGKPGWVQQVGSGHDDVTRDMTQLYGVGARCCWRAQKSAACARLAMQLRKSPLSAVACSAFAQEAGH